MRSRRWQRRLLRSLLPLVVLVLLNVVPRQWSQNCVCTNGEGTTVYVIAVGVHSGLVVPADSFWQGLLPTDPAYPYLEFGWGERGYYTDPEFSLGKGVKALLWPNEAVLHVTQWRAPPERGVPVMLCNSKYFELQNALRQSFREQAPEPLAPGLYGHRSAFYPAKGTYWLLSNCHGWTAQCLRKAGVPTPILATVGSSVRRWLPACSDPAP